MGARGKAARTGAFGPFDAGDLPGYTCSGMVESTLVSRSRRLWPIVLSLPLLHSAIGCAQSRAADLQLASISSASSSAPAPAVEPIAAASAAPPRTDLSNAPLRTLVIGDSHVFGAFGAALDKSLRARPGRQVWTYGSCGSSPMSWIRGMETPCGGYEHPEGKPVHKTLEHYRTPAIEDLLRTIRPQHTIVIMGANFLRYSVSTAPHIRQLAEILTTQGSACTWVGPPEIPDRTTTEDERMRYHKSVERLYRILTTETADKCTLLDARKMGIRAWDTVDNIHVGPVAAQKWSAEVLLAVDKVETAEVPP